LQTDFAVETKDLTKVYVDFWGRPKVRAIDRLNLSINRGEIFGLLGPNGSGKTTTIKLLLGLIFPTAGEAVVLGHPPGDVATNSRIGFLPEESYLYRFLNAEETLDFYGQIFHIPRRERKRRVADLIETVGLSFARKRPLKEYSKGMSRRIGLAQALINDPDLILLDEPTVGLDPIGSREIKDLILELKKQGKTILLSSHLLADVEDVCDRIAILDKGHLQVVGEVDDLLSLKDTLEIRVRRISPELRDKIEALLRENDAELVSTEHPSRTLEDLFLKTIEETKSEDRSSPG